MKVIAVGVLFLCIVAVPVSGEISILRSNETGISVKITMSDIPWGLGKSGVQRLRIGVEGGSIGKGGSLMISIHTADLLIYDQYVSHLNAVGGVLEAMQIILNAGNADLDNSAVRTMPDIVNLLAPFDGKSFDPEIISEPVLR